MSPHSSFRVVTLNILHDPVTGSWPQRARLVETGLCSLMPDIVLLQEVAWPDEQATALAEALQNVSGHAYTAHLTGLFATTGWQEGLAILSRFPLMDFSELQFPDAEKFCQRTRLDVNGRTVDIYNSHLDPYSAQRRREQVNMAMQWIDTFHDADGIVFGGDLNGIPDSHEIAALHTVFRSAYAATHGKDPSRIIDYLWFSPLLTVRAAELTLDQPDSGNPALYASDHLALVADFAWQS